MILSLSHPRCRRIHNEKIQATNKELRRRSQVSNFIFISLIRGATKKDDASLNIAL